ncbi:zinc-binding protein A33-like [Arapaima gigas]
MTSGKEAGLAMSLVNEVTCPLCSTLYDDPVRLDCEHNYCRKCIVKYWKEGDAIDGDDTKGYTCPLCCEIFPQFMLKSNKLLATIVARVQDLGLQNHRSLVPESKKSPKDGLGQVGETEVGKGLCPIHREPLKMYCVEEKMAICVVCGVSKEHRGHCLAPMEEILTQCEENLQAAVRRFEEQKVKIDEICKKKEEEMEAIKSESLSLHAHIVQEIDCLAQCIQSEREQLCSALQTDTHRLLALKQRASADLLQQRDVLQQQVASLSSRLGQEAQDPSALIQVSGLNTALKAEAAAVEEDAVGGFDLGLYKGPIQYAMWKRLGEVIQPGLCSLSFDPSTANPFLSLSEDLTTAHYTHSPREGLSTEESRFEFSPCVLATRGFSSGRHYWEVDVGDKSDWDVGVAGETVEREGWVVLCPENGYWTVGNRDARMVGVYLDYEGGQVSFYNAADMTPLFSYVGVTFKETVYPFFYPSADSKAQPLKILNPRVQKQ